MTVRQLVMVAICVSLPYDLLARRPDTQAIEDGPRSEVVVAGPDRNAADDGPALQRAIDSVGRTGGVVRIRAGVYRLNIHDGICALTPRRNVRIIGDGPAQTILRIGPGQPAYKGVFYPAPASEDLSGFGLQGLTIDQNGEANVIRSASDLAGNGRAVLCMFAGSGSRVDDCRFTGLAGTNSLIFNGPQVSDIRITNSQFDEVGNTSGVHYDHSTIYTHADRVHIAGNTFRGRVAGGGAFGATTAIETHGSNQIVSGNIIDGYQQGMNITGVAERSDNVIVTGNTITSAASGIQLWSYLYGSNRNRPALTNIVVSENTILIDRDPWVHVAGSSGLVSTGIAVNPSSDASIESLRIAGNVIAFRPSVNTTPSDDQSGGIEMWLTDAAVVSHNVSVIGNQITGAYGAGIRLSMSADAVDIAQNVIRNAGTSPAHFADPFRSGVMVSDLQKGVDIRDNQFVDDDPSGTMKYGIYDATAAGSTALRAVDNELRTPSASVPMFQNAGGGGSFLLSFLSDRPPLMPGHAVAVGSTITESSTGRVRSQIEAPAGTAWRSRAYGPEAPRAGTWMAGDVVYNTNPSSGGNVGWICISGGTPGVFKSFGAIER
jgi:hypothetical protein